MIMTQRTLWTVLLAILGMRLASMGLYPLMDTSEARYGEMARKMLVLGDWVTPLFDVGVPFWGKPPLSFWTQALSMKMLGINEFAVRFPAWLFHVGSCLLIIRFAREEADERTGLLAAIIFSSTALGLLSAGVVLTDPALSFSVTLASYGFWRGMARYDRRWALIGFAGLGLGLLSKGPLVWVLVGGVVLMWTVYQKRWRALLRLPWVVGISLMLLIAVPWYVIAELRTPGFLDYFLIGEHWKRYVISEWAGDLYGSAHARPVGAIWLDLLMAMFPWTLLLPVLYWRLSTLRQAWPYYSYVVVWALITPLFFTLSGNILWTYVLPALPAWSLLLAGALNRPVALGLPKVAVGLVLCLFMPFGLWAAAVDGRAFERANNQRGLAQAWQQLQQNEPGHLYYWGRRSYSGEFYTAGRARRLKDFALLPNDTVFYVARRERDLKDGIGPLQAFNCAERLRASASVLFRCGPLESSL
ncbi:MULTISPECIES: ArnT family glycosyltransferase [Pseudomonas]|uniref:ArnT family glycosyltransferase n=1 Tax=Pseudomonas TaxID=286 RepID=UPI001EF06D3F|nr:MULTISPECIES: glycosyltransferase family 39 protein [Pseudomonas]